MKRNKYLTCLLLILLVTLLLVACNSDEDEAEELEQPPTFYLLQGNERISSVEGVFCWLEEQGDTFDPEEVGGIAEVCDDETIPDFSGADFVTIPAGQAITVEMEEPLPNRVTLSLSSPDDVFLEQSRTIISVDDMIVTWEPDDAAPGDYILVALGFWRDAGGAAYYFPVTLE